MTLVRTLEEIAPLLGSVCAPTMGALHVGHEALIRLARRLADARGVDAGVVVTIFVNPTQFNEERDFARYPRDLARDVERALAAGADAVFAPDVETVYPPDVAVPVPPLPEVATTPGLEDAYRPGHLAGVCQVVGRFFELLEPVIAVFGEKDWQQLQTMRALCREQGLRVEVVGGATAREPDGIAASSRNRLLDEARRARARAIPQALRAAQRESTVAAAEAVMREVLEAADLTVEYAVVREAQTLLPLLQAGGGFGGSGDASSGGSGVSPERLRCTGGTPVPPQKKIGGAGVSAARALIAARVDDVRLIDNAPWPAAEASDWPSGVS